MTCCIARGLVERTIATEMTPPWASRAVGDAPLRKLIPLDAKGRDDMDQTQATSPAAEERIGRSAPFPERSNIRRSARERCASPFRSSTSDRAIAQCALRPRHSPMIVCDRLLLYVLYEARGRLGSRSVMHRHAASTSAGE
jgi:hypothetical protein